MSRMHRLQLASRSLPKASIVGGLLALIFLVGLFFRVWSAGEQSLWIDEGFTINAAQGVIEHGYPLLDSGRVYDKHLLTSYLTAASIKAFGLDPFSPWPARVPSIAFGSLLILAVYSFARKLSLGRLLPLCAALATALISYEIAWSRQARGYAGLSFFLVVSFSLLIAAYQRKKLWYGIGAAACFALGVLSHGLGIIFLPAFASLAVSACLVASGRMAASRKLWYIAAVASVLGSFAILPFLGVDIRFSASYLVLVKADSLLLPLFSVAVIGIALSLFDAKKRDIVPFAAVPFAATAVILCFMLERRGFKYLFPLIPFALVLATYAVARSCEFLPTFRGKAAVSAAALALIVCGGVTIVPRSEYSFDRGYIQPDFKSAFLYMKENMQPGDVVISPYSHLHEIYLGKPGLHLVMNLRNKSYEDQTETENAFNAVAPLVNGLPAFKDAVSKNHGFVFFDAMAYNHLEDYMYALTGMKGVSKAYEKGKDILDDMIRVYRF